MLTKEALSEALAIAARHHEAGRLGEAEQIYRQILAIDPQDVDALHLLGVIGLQTGQHETAVEYIRRAIELAPSQSTMHLNLGTCLQAQGKRDEAVLSLQRAAELAPDNAGAHYNLGNALTAQEKLDEAIGAYRRAVELNPQHAKANNNLGTALLPLWKLDEAAACFRRILELQPECAEAHTNLGNVLKDQGKLDEAVACYRRALDLNPELPTAHDNLLYTLSFCPNFDSAMICEEHRLWNRRWAEPLAGEIAPHTNDATPERRVRIGYVSPNFRMHAEAHFLSPLFAAHNHRQFEIFCYSDVVSPDHITAKLRSCSDVWRSTTGLSDEALAQLVRGDQIDILVDLTMHMAQARPLLFARKPAPVQVCWLAYQGTTGLTTVDYRLTDRELDPPGLFDSYYSEESVRLADSFWCYDPLTEGPTVSELPARRNGYVTFGCLNNFCKVTAGVLRLWARVLSAVEWSRLLLLAPEGSSRESVLRLLATEGISADRVAFVTRQPRLSYLELYDQIDIGLDTLPYNGQTTTLDAAWMGVPVVTQVGKTAVGRAGLSMNNQLGLTDLVAETPEQFVKICECLANDLPWLTERRATLRGRLEKS